MHSRLSTLNPFPLTVINKWHLNKPQDKNMSRQYWQSWYNR